MFCYTKNNLKNINNLNRGILCILIKNKSQKIHQINMGSPKVPILKHIVYNFKLIRFEYK